MSHSLRRLALSAGGCGLLLASSGAFAQDPSSPGAVTAPYPTFHNVSVEWALGGDDDVDGYTTVRYREVGVDAWTEGLPLKRVVAGSNQGFSWTNKHAGSVFGLNAGTSYEVELSLTDPDGGSAVEVITATTRAWPVVSGGAPQTPVTPGTIDAALLNAGPGDVLLLADGIYGDIAVGQSGTAGAPIVVMAENPGGAVIAGEVRMDGQAHVWIEDLTVQGQIKFNNADSIVVRGCTIVTDNDGIVSYANGVQNGLFVDNTITGPTLWDEAALGASGTNNGEGIAITGPGNVIAFNRVEGFRDCISLLEDSGANQQLSIDIYGNDLDRCADDAIEADFAMGNVRVYQNRILNSFMGISSQPSLGGPTYFVRNVMQNIVLSAFKLQRSSVGDVGLHNTVIKSGDAFGVFTTDVWYAAVFRNNLFIGGPGGTYNGYNIGPGRVMHLPSADPSCSFDYTGYGSIGTGTFNGDVAGVNFDGLVQMQSLTTEENAVEVDMTIFEQTVPFPSDPIALAQPVSLALAEGSVAQDAGLVLANINDGFGAAGPDLGAYEIGQTLPVYGPDGSLGSGSGSGGAGTGGQGGSGGGDGGPGGGGGSSSGGADPSGGASPDSADSVDDGCGCRVQGSRSSHRWPALFIAAWVAAIARRRRDATCGEKS